MLANWNRRLLKGFTLASVVLSVCLYSVSPAGAATEVVLAWDANIEPDLAGYRIRYGTSPGNYTLGLVQVSKATTTTTITGLNAATTYYFVAHAYDFADNESFPSNEVSAVPTVVVGPVLTLSLSDSPDPVSAGGDITYTLDYGNTGDRDATGVTISSAIPANTSFNSATNGGSLSGGTVTWSIGTLPPGASGSIQMSVQVVSPLADGTQIVNDASSIDSNETSPVSATTATTTVTSAPILAISISDSPDPVVAGNLLAYTFSYSNSGNANTTGVVITDTIPANTSFDFATDGGTYSSGVVTWNIGPLSAGDSGMVQVVVRVLSAAVGTTISNGNYQIDSNETSPVSGAAAITAVISAPAPTISNAVEQGTASTYVLQSGVHTVVVTGTNFLNGATLELGAGITVNSASVPGSTQIVADITVAANASLGGRTVSVTNPDGRVASRISGLIVIKTTDANRDCNIDSLDLNLIARAYGASTGSANYDAAADLDGDGTVDGDDLAGWVTYFGQALQVCP
jgi:uncharacterized repeat protein (TIGR01451 family)